MLRKLLVGLLVFVGIYVAAPSMAVTAPKPGSACSKVGSSVTVSGKKFTCIKAAGKKKWDKGVLVKVVAKPSPTPTNDTGPWFLGDGPCGFEAKIPAEWLPLQQYMKNGSYGCLGPVQVVKANLPAAVPQTRVTDPAQLLSVEACKLQNGQVSNTRAFPSPGREDWFKTSRHPSSNSVIQVVAISATDAPTTGTSPTQDYGRYFDFLKNYYSYASDGVSNFEIRVPSQYFSLGYALGKSAVAHDSGNGQQERQNALGRQILQAVDSQINFSDVDYVIVVAPAGTSPDVVEQGALGRDTRDGKYLPSIMFAQPYSIDQPITRHRAFMNPMWWLHEMQHVGLGLEDHNGDNYWQNGKGENTNTPGMGNWGIMSMALTDFTTWEKWLLGLTSDSQVRCTSATETTTHWLAPSSYKTDKSKMVVIPLSGQEVLVIESIRAKGLNYKLSSESEGALVYTVNTTDLRREYGLNVLLADGVSFVSKPFIHANAPMKPGQTLVYKGIKVSVLERGTFGDVVKVEKN